MVFTCLKSAYFLEKLIGGYIVAKWQCNHGEICSDTKVTFHPNFLTKRQRLSCEMVWNILRNNCKESSGFLHHLNQDIFWKN